MNYCMSPSYTPRLNPGHHDDRTYEDAYQNEVYEYALSYAKQNGFCTVCDVGCGSAFKLMKYFKDFITIGIETEPCLSYLMEKYPTRLWYPSGEAEKNLPEKIHSADLVICCDVVEHIVNPDLLMNYLAAMNANAFILSTPDRAVLESWGWPPNGPPRNECHVREWNESEFVAYVSQFFTVTEVSHGASQTECMWLLCVKRVS